MKILAQNKRARFDYVIADTLTAGIVLSGAEVKSAKLGQVSLKGSFITISSGEAYLVNAHFTPYNHAGNNSSLDPTRSRKLLLHRKQIDTLIGKKQAGLSAVPLSLSLERSLIKVEVGMGRGKKQHDKRETIKKRDQLREAQRSV